MFRTLIGVEAAFEAALTGVSDTASMFNPCIRASVVRQIGGFDERLATIGEDALFMASVTRICDAEYIPTIIVRKHENHAYDQLSQTVSPSAFDKFLEIHTEKFGDELNRRPKAARRLLRSSSSRSDAGETATPRYHQPAQGIQDRAFQRVQPLAPYVCRQGIHLVCYPTETD